MDNDLISRSALKETMKKRIVSTNHNAITLNREQRANNDAILECIDAIDTAPTVKTEITNEDLQNAMTESFKNGYEMAKAKYERPQGEWITTRTLKHDGNPYCSNCDEETIIRYNFCPNCGAKMKGGAE